MKEVSLTVAMVLALGAAVAAQGIDQKKKELVGKLDGMRLDVKLNDSTLEEAMAFIRDMASINIVVDASVYEDRSAEEVKVTLKVKDLRLKSILKLILSMHDLGAQYKEGVLLIMPKSKMNREVITQIHDVRDLLFKIRDFPGPKVELVSSSTGGTPLTGAIFTVDEERESAISDDFLVDMIQQNTGGASWDENENASVTLSNGLLFVTQSKKVQREVKQLLLLLRQYR